MKSKFVLFLLLFLNFISYSQIYLRDVEVTANRNDTTYGIDVSKHQGKIDWNRIDSNIKFVIIKVTEGVDRVDNSFVYNWKNCNLIKGGYHFFRPQYSGIEQGKFFLKNLHIDSGNIRPVIDVEYTKHWFLKRKRKSCVYNLTKMIHYIRDNTGVYPIIYTTGLFWNNYVYPYYKDGHDLWIADYRKIEHPKTPKNMGWVIWQYTCKGKVCGINKLVDKNVMLKDLGLILIGK
jgi:lysozyme